MPTNAGTSARRIRISASFLRGYIAYLAERGRLEAVRARLPPDVRAVVADPPPVFAWVDGRVIEAIDEAHETVAGPGVHREASREVTRAALVPPLRAVVAAVLELFGATPHALYARLQFLSHRASEGIEYEYTRTGDRACEVLVRYAGRRDVAPRTFAGLAGLLAVALDLCGVEGEVSEPELVDDPRGDAARYVIRW